MTGPSLLIVGCGDLGLRVGTALVQQGWQIGALRRNPPAAPENFQWLAANYSQPGSLDFARDWRPDHVLTSFNPAGRDVAGYRAGFADAAHNLLQGLGEHRPGHIFMVSSTRVYAERNGGWVDENSPLSTDDEQAMAIVDAERQLLDSPHPCSVIRCGGVYGAIPSRLLQKIARGEVAPREPLRYTNRIHREDAAGFLTHLLVSSQGGQAVEPVYNCVDDETAPAHDVESWLAEQLGVKPNDARKRDATTAPNHKRCRNTRLHESGYRLRYPDFRAGYGHMLSSNQ